MNTEKTGKLISTLRRERNLTQAELAELICVSDKAISRWETGRGFPDVNNLEALAENLDVTVAELLKGEKIETPISKDDLKAASSESFSLAKAVLRRKKYINILINNRRRNRASHKVLDRMAYIRRTAGETAPGWCFATTRSCKRSACS